jgi:hypothetical protein
MNFCGVHAPAAAVHDTDWTSIPPMRQNAVQTGPCHERQIWHGQHTPDELSLDGKCPAV